ncbi:hypothetical protein HMI54_014317 [Coelomomyces lativittatus]|nr:hypothetical protein HMI56_004631 [Coelomomyces lativittatus]KAJ1514254.1 hypothetical protein HMI54_014317 [Coelomomyces lativittatus]KAJ1516126.1 hypothetical protein HMI55_002926 [Coelomomyces lativittatus]
MLFTHQLGSFLSVLFFCIGLLDPVTSTRNPISKHVRHPPRSTTTTSSGHPKRPSSFPSPRTAHSFLKKDPKRKKIDDLRYMNPYATSTPPSTSSSSVSSKHKKTKTQTETSVHHTQDTHPHEKKLEHQEEEEHNQANMKDDQGIEGIETEQEEDEEDEDEEEEEEEEEEEDEFMVDRGL